MKQKHLFIASLLCLTLAMFGCKNTKTIVSNGALNSNLSSKQLIKNHKKNSTNFKTLTARLKIDVIQETKSQGYSVSLRMEKDKSIWISKLGIVKALITPNRVAFYNKLDNTYFDGDFSYISELLGTDLNFQNLQNLLFGEAIYSLNDSGFKLSLNDKSYVLQPKNQNTLFEIFYLLNPTHFKMDSQQIGQQKETRFLQIDYTSYQDIDKQTLPEQTRIIAVEGSDQTVIELEFKGIELNEDVRFPFKIPSGYDEIQIN